MAGFNFPLLKELCETPGVSGREDPIRKVAARELAAMGGAIEGDAMGNVIGRFTGKGPRVMIAAHVDEIGFYVRHIDDGGFLRLQPIGGWDPRAMFAQRVLVHTRTGGPLRGAVMPATKPRHMLTPEEAARALKVEDFFVDLGLPGNKVKKLVERGDPVTMDRTAERIGDTVVSKTLDDRLGVFVMLEAVRAATKARKKPVSEILAVATVQEEVGLRGAIPASYHLQPDIGIALDVTIANDFAGSGAQDHVTELGKGCAIKVIDSSLICHPAIVRHFRDIADEAKIPYQLELLPAGGTDAGGVQRSRAGVPSFTLSVPTRYVHTVNEMAHVDDIQGAVKLLAAWLAEAHTRQYAYAVPAV